MRHFLFILSLCLWRTGCFSQVGPPSLRCLAVAPNGDVTLTWLAPADPGNVFAGYEIWYSPALYSGPYTLINTLPSITTTSYLHAGTNANNQSGYYYMRSKYGPGGTIFSGNSDTLRTIFVNITTVPSAIKISFNQLHQPRLATTSSTFTIWKEYPAGTWSVLATTTDLSFPDTLTVCQASLSYYTTLTDGSGCTSISSIQRGVYGDSNNPNEPSIDSVSVLPNGNTIIAWTIPRDKDIVKYCIYNIVAGGGQAIDTVYGYNNTFYVLSTTSSGLDTIGLSVAAIDSCSRPSTFNLNVRSMLLQAKYNRCDYQTELSWNSYTGMRNGVKEYRIYCSENGGPLKPVGVTQNTSFVHTNVIPNKNLVYYVRVFNNGLTISATSNGVVLFSKEVDIPKFVYMKTATVSGKSTAQIRLFLDTSKACRGIDILRSEDGQTFKPAGFIATGAAPEYVFNDEGLETGVKSYYYRATIKDSCGNTRLQSNTCKTILLGVKDDAEMMFTKHLTWSHYEGFDGGISGYRIYRVVNEMPSPQPVGYTGQYVSSYTDNLEGEASNGARIEYLVEAVEGNKNTYGFTETSNSNRKPVYVEGRIFIPSAFAPNGLNQVWLPVTHFIDKQEYRLMIYNRWGNKLFETTDDTKGWDGSDAEGAVYAYQISYKNSRGEYKELTGTLLLIR